MSYFNPFKELMQVLVVWTCLVPTAPAGSALPTELAHAESSLIVIAPEAWLDSLQPFIEHKQTLLPTNVVGLESILTSMDGKDDPEKVKHFLFQQYSTNKVRYALLVGDVDMFPVRYMVLDRHTAAAFNYAFYPSDLYYSDLFKQDGTSFEDWNGNRTEFHASYFGEVRGETNKHDPINFDSIDYQPELAVGRWPVSTVEQLQTVIKKTIEYESQSKQRTPEQRPRVALYSVGGWVDSRPVMDFAAERFGNWDVSRRYYSDQGRPSDHLPTHTILRKDFADGVDLILHAGHGTQNGWHECLGMKDLAMLDNATRLPVILSVGCSTAHFAPEPPYMSYTDIDKQDHRGTNNGETFDAPPPSPSPYQKKFNTSGLGESLLRDNASGAVAYIGCCTGSQPCGLTLIKGFSDAMNTNQPKRLGDIWMHAIRYYYRAEKLDELQPTESWYPPSIYFQGMKFMVFGDPTLELGPARSTPDSK